MTDERIQQTIGMLLRAGVLLSAAVVGAGAVWYLAAHGSAPVQLHPGAQIAWTGPQSVMLAGLVLLVATPVVRVGFSLVAFFLERDYMYVAISSVVMAVLLFSIVSALM